MMTKTDNKYFPKVKSKDGTQEVSILNMLESGSSYAVILEEQGGTTKARPVTYEELETLCNRYDLVAPPRYKEGRVELWVKYKSICKYCDFWDLIDVFGGECANPIHKKIRTGMSEWERKYLLALQHWKRKQNKTSPFYKDNLKYFERNYIRDNPPPEHDSIEYIKYTSAEDTCQFYRRGGK